MIGDDPSTPQIEPCEPAVLGLLVTNVGGGTANNLSITTAQPQIVQNEKGLANTFQIIGTQVGNQQVTPSLTVDLGDVEPGQTADAELLAALGPPGRVGGFHRHFQPHRRAGGHETSLISSVQTHSLIHAGDFNYPNSTGETDYLVNDIPNPESLPDTIYFSDGTTAPVNVATDVSSSPVGPSSALTFQVTADVTSGWDYLHLPDPGAGYTLYKVVRSDGTVIPVSDQAWTDRRHDLADRQVDRRLRAAHPRRQQHRLVHGLLPADDDHRRPPSPRSRRSPARRAARSARSTSRSRNRSTPPRSRLQNLTLTLNGGANLINSVRDHHPGFADDLHDRRTRGPYGRRRQLYSDRQRGWRQRLLR